MNDTSYITKTKFKGVLQINRPTFSDDRGFFRESVRTKDLEKVFGKPFNVVQANHARSSRLTLRGIHVAPWNKLIYVSRGKVQTVIVDLHEDSPTFGTYESFVLGDENRSSIFIPAGYGNSYLVLSDEADYTYLTDDEWAPGKEYGIAWDDSTLSVKWKIAEKPILSERDTQNPTLKEKFPNKFK